jgi:hypothetical protein
MSAQRHSILNNLITGPSVQDPSLVAQPLECGGKAKRRHRFGINQSVWGSRNARPASKAPSTLRFAGALQTGLHLAAGLLALLGALPELKASPVALNTNLQIRLVLNTANGSANSVQIAKDPRNDQLYYLKINGDVFKLTLSSDTNSSATRIASAADHGLSTKVQGMAIGPDGTIYIVANISTNSGNSNIARIMKGTPVGSGSFNWSMLAQTEPYPLSRSAFDHLANGLAVSPDGQFLFLNSGSRTDHGEVESTGGLYPNLRDAPLTAKIMRVPTSASNLILSNDLNALKAAGYVFAEGTRNAFSLAFGPGDDLFATDNGPDRDMSDELNWMRPGMHYGFPWRMGGADNPQQFPNYDPSTDLLLDSRFGAVANGTYHNDPTFPPPPTNFAEPVINLGPDACSYRDPSDGSIKIASQLGQTLSSVTAHRSPLGLVFDNSSAMAPPLQKHGFMLSWTQGDPNDDSIVGPFLDASQDLVDLALTKLGNTNYEARITRLVSGFSNPISAAIIQNKIYVIEYGGNQGIWEITFPPAPFKLTEPAWLRPGVFGFNITGGPGASYFVETSSNLVLWTLLTNSVATNGPVQFWDFAATNFPDKFYRVRSQ